MDAEDNYLNMSNSVPYSGSLSALQLPGAIDSPHLIILHGWGHNLQIIRPLGELLTDSGRVHLIDLPGFGGSPVPTTTWGTEDYATCIKRYLDEQQIERAIFVGHSFGGKTSLKLANLFPEKVIALVLINSSGLKGHPPLKRRLKIRYVKSLRAVLRFLQNRFGIRWYDQWFIPRFSSPDYKNAGPLKDTFVKVVNEELSPEIANIKVPALCLWGDKDTETPLEMGERMNKTLQHGKLVVLEGQGHTPFAGPGAAVCAFHIKRFLECLKDNSSS